MALKHFPSLLLAGLSTSCNALATASRDTTITTIPSTSHYEIGIDSTGYQWPWRVYKTSTFHPPNMTITRSGAPLADGYIFMTPWPNSNETHQSAGFIMTDEGDMVYCVPIVGMHNFRVQKYDGQSYLTYWNGYNAAFPQVGHGYGQVNFVDSELKNSSVKGLDLGINTLTNSTRAYGVFDIHEAQMTGRDSLLVTVYNNTQADLTSLGGAVDGWIVDCLVFEIDVATGEVLFEWKALDHFPLSLSRQPLVTTLGNGTIGAPYDWFHMNSIERVGSDYLVSARHVYSIFMVSEIVYHFGFQLTSPGLWRGWKRSVASRWRDWRGLRCPSQRSQLPLAARCPSLCAERVEH